MSSRPWPRAQLRVEARLERLRPQLVQAAGRLGREGRVADVGERWAAEEGQRLPQNPGRLVRVPGRERLASALQPGAEAVEVELSSLDDEPIARSLGDEDCGRVLRCARALEAAAQRRDMALQRRRGRLGRALAPDRVDQAVGGDDAVGVQQQGGEHSARPGSAEPHRSGVHVDLQRAQDPVLATDGHSPNVPPAAGR